MAAKKPDFGFYGKGLDGYVHYRQGMKDIPKPETTAANNRQNGPTWGMVGMGILGALFLLAAKNIANNIGSVVCAL